MDFEWMVADEFGGLAGLKQEDRLPYLPLCISAAHQIKSRLKPGVSLKEHKKMLCTAAAAVALYRYVLLRAAVEEGSFTAGDLRVTQGAGAEKAAKYLRNEALAAVSPLLRDSDFVFWQVI